MLKSTLRTDADFEAFYKKYWKYVLKLCLSYMKNQTEAEDVASDVFVKILSDAIVFNDELHERKWLTVVSINMCKNRLKSRKRRIFASIEDRQDLSVSEIGMQNDILDAVMGLPVKYKDVIWLYYYEGYKTHEIAALLKRPPSTVRGQIRDARNLLKKILGGDLS